MTGTDPRSTMAPCAAETYRCAAGAACSTRAAKHEATGRWFITMGHAGFNLPTNNGHGYATEGSAVKASMRCEVGR